MGNFISTPNDHYYEKLKENMMKRLVDGQSYLEAAFPLNEIFYDPLNNQLYLSFLNKRS